MVALEQDGDFVLQSYQDGVWAVIPRPRELAVGVVQVVQAHQAGDCEVGGVLAVVDKLQGHQYVY